MLFEEEARLRTPDKPPVACPCCAADDQVFWAEEGDYQVVRCGSCRLLFVSPRPSLERIDAAVRTGVQSISGRPVDVRARRIPAKVARYRRLVAHLFDDLIAAGRPVRWVDVGSGYGEVLEALRQALPRGSEIIGVEPMAHKAAAARALGLDVVEGYLEPGQFDADVISNIDVFSHIPDYHGFLATVVSNLRPGGELMIETGNLAELEHRSEFPYELGLPDHLVFAGRPQMERYFDRAGVAIVREHHERFDTVTQMVKNTVKIALGRPSKVRIPYTSKYRQSIFRARLRD